MFDDIQQNKNNDDLPQEEAEKGKINTDYTNPQNVEVNKEPEDIFEEVDKVDNNRIKPLSEQTGSEFMTQEDIDMPDLDDAKKHKSKTIVIIAVIIILATISAWATYTYLITPNITETSMKKVDDTTKTGLPTTNIVNTPTNENKNINTQENELEIKKPIDSDSDGLTDEDEIRFGTNPNLSDTDQDGLSDQDEIAIYKTDPKKPDSDNDGYRDGEEVENGYNPLGEGKLLDKVELP